MSNEIMFRPQLASIMEVLANAAVEEICKLVDDGYAVLHLQMSEYVKENEALKVRLHLMELKAARACAAERARAREREHRPAPDPYPDGALTLRDKPRGAPNEGLAVAGNNRALGNPGDVCAQVFHATVDENNPNTAFGFSPVEPAGADSDRNETILIKEEIPDSISDAHADMKIPVQGALEACAGEERVPALGLGASPAERPEEQRAGRGTAVWECADMEEETTELILIKEESVEEDRDPQRAMNSREEGLMARKIFSAAGVARIVVEDIPSSSSSCSENDIENSEEDDLEKGDGHQDSDEDNALVSGLVEAHGPNSVLIERRRFSAERRTSQCHIQRHKPYIPAQQSRSEAAHLPIQTTSRRCAECSSAKEPHRTKWMCTKCQVGLCISQSKNCFLLYHKK